MREFHRQSLVNVQPLILMSLLRDLFIYLSLLVTCFSLIAVLVFDSFQLYFCGVNNVIDILQESDGDDDDDDDDDDSY